MISSWTFFCLVFRFFRFKRENLPLLCAFCVFAINEFAAIYLCAWSMKSYDRFCIERYYHIHSMNYMPVQYKKCIKINNNDDDNDCWPEKRHSYFRTHQSTMMNAFDGNFTGRKAAAVEAEAAKQEYEREREIVTHAVNTHNDHFYSRNSSLYAEMGMRDCITVNKLKSTALSRMRSAFGRKKLYLHGKQSWCLFAHTQRTRALNIVWASCGDRTPILTVLIKLISNFLLPRCAMLKADIMCYIQMKWSAYARLWNGNSVKMHFSITFDSWLWY